MVDTARHPIKPTGRRLERHRPIPLLGVGRGPALLFPPAGEEDEGRATDTPPPAPERIDRPGVRRRPAYRGTGRAGRMANRVPNPVHSTRTCRSPWARIPGSRRAPMMGYSDTIASRTRSCARPVPRHRVRHAGRPLDSDALFGETPPPYKPRGLKGTDGNSPPPAAAGRRSPPPRAAMQAAPALRSPPLDGPRTETRAAKRWRSGRRRPAAATHGRHGHHR